MPYARYPVNIPSSSSDDSDLSSSGSSRSRVDYPAVPPRAARSSLELSSCPTAYDAAEDEDDRGLVRESRARRHASWRDTFLRNASSHRGIKPTSPLCESAFQPQNSKSETGSGAGMFRGWRTVLLGSCEYGSWVCLTRFIC
jgi:hypothetical protein